MPVGYNTNDEPKPTMDWAKKYPHAHPATLDTLEFFEWSHLPESLQAVSAPYSVLAHELVSREDLGGSQLTIALQKLLESKDCAVRAAL